MIFRAQGIRNLLKWSASGMLVLGLSLFPLAQASSSQSKAKKPTVTQTAEKGKKGKNAKAAVVKRSAKKEVQAAGRSADRKKSSAVAKRAIKGTVQAKAGKRPAQHAKGSRLQQQAWAKSHAKAGARVASVVRAPQEPRSSQGERLGLRASHDPLDLNSSVALVMDQDTSEVLFSKNDTAVLPIASLTKLMTGLVIADAQLPLDELITITDEDAAVYRNSRLAVGATVTRGELMHLALMSSENRAAYALGRTFPGGMQPFVRRMNAMARELGMRHTRYVEPTGLSSLNQASARDLATLVQVAYERPILRSLSTSPSHQLELGHRTLQYNNSNRLIRNPEWDIGLQKTGYIAEAGRCLVMQAKVAGRQVIMVFLDSTGKLSRAQDAERVRRWVEAQSIQQYFVRPQG